MAKPKPKAPSDPTGAPRALPPHTRTDPGQQHPWEPPEAALATPPTAAEPGPAPAASQARAPERPPARARDVDLSQWAKMINVSALKVGAARRKLDQRETELAGLVDQARAASADDALVRAWLVAAGLSPDELPLD